MSNELQSIETETFSEAAKKYHRRRDLLPIWIKVFIWIFMIFGAIALIGLVLGLFGMNIQLAFLGLETNNPLSITGIFIILMFLTKGIIAYGLWTEKTWAINIAKIEAIISGVICVLLMFGIQTVYQTSSFNVRSFNIRFELILLVLYYNKLSKIEYDWEAFDH